MYRHEGVARLIPFPAVAGETSVERFHFAITLAHDRATFSAVSPPRPGPPQLWMLFGSLKPMKKLRLTYAGTSWSMLERHLTSRH